MPHGFCSKPTILGTVPAPRPIPVPIAPNPRIELGTASQRIEQLGEVSLVIAVGLVKLGHVGSPFLCWLRRVVLRVMSECEASGVFASLRRGELRHPCRSKYMSQRAPEMAQPDGPKGLIQMDQIVGRTTVPVHGDDCRAAKQLRARMLSIRLRCEICYCGSANTYIALLPGVVSASGVRPTGIGDRAAARGDRDILPAADGEGDGAAGRLAREAASATAPGRCRRRAPASSDPSSR